MPGIVFCRMHRVSPENRLRLISEEVRMLRRCMLSLFVLVLFAVPVSAHKIDDAPHQTFAVGDFPLENGTVIRDFSVSYVTHGTLNAAKDNAVLVLAPFAGDHHHLDALIGSKNAFDTDKLFVICVDPIGNGLTTSPSNSATQPGPLFPQFSILDMVSSQHRLLTEQFGITKLFAVVGASMGGMQSLQWAVGYPDSVSNVVALVPAARVSPWTRTQMELQRQAIMLDPAWNGGTYTRQPEQGLRLWAGLLFGVALSTPQAVNAVPEEEGKERLHLFQDRLWNLMDANNILAQISACETFDLGNTPGFNGDTKTALASIKARTLILLGENDLIVPEAPMVEDAAHIPHATVKWVKTGVQLGHFAGTGNVELDFKHDVIAEFLAGKGK